MFQTTRSKVGAIVLAAASLPSLAGCFSERDDVHRPNAHPDATIQPSREFGRELFALETERAEALARIKGEGPLHNEERLRTRELYHEKQGVLLEEAYRCHQSEGSELDAERRRSLEDVKKQLQELEDSAKKVGAKDSCEWPKNDEPPGEMPAYFRWIRDGKGRHGFEALELEEWLSKWKSQHPGEGER